MGSNSVGKLVYNYLKGNGYEDFAVKLAKKLNLEATACSHGPSLESLYQEFLKASEVNNNHKEAAAPVSAGNDLVGSNTDSVGQMVHNHLKANGYDDFAATLAQKLNLDPEPGLDGQNLDSIYQEYLIKNAAELNNNCKDVTPISEKSDLIGLIVHEYLKDNSYDDLSEGLAQKLSLDLGKDLHGASLKSIYQKYHKAESVKRKQRTWGSLDEKTRQKMMTSPNPELSMSVCPIRGTLILNYKEYEYTFNFQLVNNGNVRWQCRYFSNPRCNKCRGSIIVHWPSGAIVSFTEHTHAPDTVRHRLEESSMGTGDATLRYSLSRKKTPVLHYRGYAYLKSTQMRKTTTSEYLRWMCREGKKKPMDPTQKRCSGYLYTNQGQVIGKVREHNHLPTDVKPQVMEDGNRMLTPLLL